LSAGYGYFRTNAKEIETGIKLAVAQGSIEQLKKWDPDYKNYILARYEKLTRGAAKEDVDLIIWPETALPGLLDDDEMRLYLKKIAALSDARLFSGALTCRSEPGRDIFFNSAVLFTAGGQAEKKYDKIHLVPFGEYIPFEARIPFLRGSINAEIGDCSPGAEFTTFEIKAISGEKYKYAALICFEDIFPGLARKFVLKGADFLVNITNDAWFRESGEQLQHAQASVFRAVENRVSIVRAANNGFSCFISPKGIIEDWLPGEGRGSIYAPGSKAFNLKIMRQRTFYSAYGDLFILICISIISCYFIDFSKITI
jgi:apolipoprotein N-acyltransferase